MGEAPLLFGRQGLLKSGRTAIARTAEGGYPYARHESISLQTSQAVPNSANTCSVLLRELIDYAGLFPPASLPMTRSVANYDAYLRSEWNWGLGRLIVPVARLGEFEEAYAGLQTPLDEDGALTNWRLSVLLGADPAADVARLRQFNERMGGSSRSRSAVIESVEVKITSAEEIRRLSGIIPAELATYFEIPLAYCSECIRALADCGRRAKIRMGGETADKFPASESVIEFIRQCAANGADDVVPFKATAGLHHPLRSVQRLTYQPESPSGMMHGFLNVFLAAAFLRAGMTAEVAQQLLEEQSAQVFHFDLDGAAWRQHRLSRDEIAAVRAGFAISFGSCSFTEPIDDLGSLHLL